MNNIKYYIRYLAVQFRKTIYKKYCSNNATKNIKFHLYLSNEIQVIFV
jgi:hypothetical protein